MNKKHFYEKRAESYTAFDRQGFARYQRALKLTDISSGVKILDIGCKHAFLCDFLEEHGLDCDYYGLDISEKVVEALQHKKGSFQVCDVMKGLPFEDHQFDYIFCLEVLEHVEYPTFLLNQFHRVLKGDGTILLSVPNPYNWLSILVELFGVDDKNRSSIVVMTFNTQQSNNDKGERSFEEQLALIRKVSPDVLALQETDSARISLNNNDYARYFAENLGYYSYYGPSTVTGTYGTTILSKYPLLNTRTVFTFSDKDEIGTAEAEIDVNGIRIPIYDVHPDGSDTAMLVFAKSLLERSQSKPYVIALGDYKLRDYEEAYQLIDSVYTRRPSGTASSSSTP